MMSALPSKASDPGDRLAKRGAVRPQQNQAATRVLASLVALCTITGSARAARWRMAGVL
jgi:hypothetical protein